MKRDLNYIPLQLVSLFSGGDTFDSTIKKEGYRWVAVFSGRDWVKIHYWSRTNSLQGH